MTGSARMLATILGLGALALPLVAPVGASGKCLSSTSGEWSATDALGDQVSASFTDLAALHVRLDSSCRLTVTVDLNGGLDREANLVMYDLDTDSILGADHWVQVSLPRVDRPQSAMLSLTQGPPRTLPDLTVVQTTGFTVPLDSLMIPKPGTILVRAGLWEMSYGTGDFVPGLDNWLTAPLVIADDTQAPVNVAAPTIGGTHERGETLACAQGSWTGAGPISYAFSWLRDDQPILDASARTYETTADDVGHLVACRVTATGAVGSATADSAGMAIRDSVAPRISALAVRPARLGRRGGLIGYRLAEPALVTFSVQRRTATGRFVTLPGQLRHDSNAGSTTFRFRPRGYAPGVYRLVARARDPFGNTGPAVRAMFRVT